MSPRRIPVASILLEASFVVLGVFLALALNEWRGAAHERDRAALARESLVDEVRANREAVREARDYHAALRDSLYARDADRPPTPRMFPRGFVRPATARTTAWDAATAADAVAAMDYGEVLVFSDLYAAQERYATAAEQGGRVIYQALYDAGADGVAANARNLIHLVSAYQYLEEGLLRDYDRALATLAPEAAGD